MKITYTTCLLDVGNVSKSHEWVTTFSQIQQVILNMGYPVDPGPFIIYGQSGKKRGEGNGVVPIKEILMSKLPNTCCREIPLPLNSGGKLGKLDVVATVGNYRFALEWETGNVSSSHRAVNKMLLGLYDGAIQAVILIVPVKNFAQYLTDRIGNYEELAQYFPLWRQQSIPSGILYILGIEHDSVSMDVPRFPKGTDGRAII